jgi:hypothetical protein
MWPLHTAPAQQARHAVSTLKVAILEGRDRKQDGTERYLVGRQPASQPATQLSGHYGTDRQT